jgi:uncharacterized protein (DUF111 family)
MRQGTFFLRIHIEPVGGVAGDMLLGALIDLGADRRAIRATFSSFHLKGLFLKTRRVVVLGERALHVQSIAPDRRHRHRHLDELLETIAGAQASPWVHDWAARVFMLMAQAEAAAHHCSVDEVTLHEVGQLDSILDVVGIGVALDSLGRPNLTSAPLPSGHGVVHTSHGVLDLPVPAVKKIAATSSLDLRDVDVEGETITPTGAAVLAATGVRFAARPKLRPHRIGVGAGTRRFPARANVLRMYGWR